MSNHLIYDHRRGYEVTDDTNSDWRDRPHTLIMTFEGTQVINIEKFFDLDHAWEKVHLAAPELAEHLWQDVYPWRDALKVLRRLPPLGHENEVEDYDFAVVDGTFHAAACSDYRGAFTLPNFPQRDFVPSFWVTHRYNDDADMLQVSPFGVRLTRDGKEMVSYYYTNVDPRAAKRNLRVRTIYNDAAYSAVQWELDGDATAILTKALKVKDVESVGFANGKIILYFGYQTLWGHRYEDFTYKFQNDFPKPRRNWHHMFTMPERQHTLDVAGVVTTSTMSLTISAEYLRDALKSLGSDAAQGITLRTKLSGELATQPVLLSSKVNSPITHVFAPQNLSRHYATYHPATAPDIQEYLGAAFRALRPDVTLARKLLTQLAVNPFIKVKF